MNGLVMPREFALFIVNWFCWGTIWRSWKSITISVRRQTHCTLEYAYIRTLSNVPFYFTCIIYIHHKRVYIKVRMIVRLRKPLCMNSRPFLKGHANDAKRTKDENDVVRPCRITGSPGGRSVTNRFLATSNREKTLMHVAEPGCHSSQMRANLS